MFKLTKLFHVPAVTLLVFLALFYAGLKIAQTRGLWNDEIFTQLQSIQTKSYLTILNGQIPEGNNFPLFYLTQKLITERSHFQLSNAWQGQGFGYDAQGQKIMRFQGNAWMSLALAIVFGFFSYYFSYRWGLYTLSLFLTSSLVWVYWAEARPYGVWIALTAIQSLVILRMTWQERISTKWWLILALVQTLLSLTAVIGVVQSIIATSVIVFLKRSDKRILFYQLIHLVVIGWFYHSRALHFETWFDRSPIDIFFMVTPKFQFIIPILLVGFLIYSVIVKKNREELLKNLRGLEFNIFAGVILISGLMLMNMFILKDQGGPKGFTVSPRYFVFLLPGFFMMQSVAAADLFRSLSNGWLKVGLVILLLFIVLQVFLNDEFVCFSVTNLYLNF